MLPWVKLAEEEFPAIWNEAECPEIWKAPEEEEEGAEEEKEEAFEAEGASCAEKDEAGEGACPGICPEIWKGEISGVLERTCPGI